MTKVVFRKFKKGGDIVALFPEQRYSPFDYTIDSYQHVGQHGAADYAYVLTISRLAGEDEYQPLLAELKSIGYDDLQVMKRCRPKYS